MTIFIQFIDFYYITMKYCIKIASSSFKKFEVHRKIVFQIINIIRVLTTKIQ